LVVVFLFNHLSGDGHSAADEKLLDVMVAAFMAADHYKAEQKIADVCGDKLL
jgi:hypothetical protein